MKQYRPGQNLAFIYELSSLWR